MKRPLTEGECRVLECLADDYAEFKDIGPALGVSINTVKRLAWNAYQKLGVGNRYRAVDRHKALLRRGHACHHLRLQREQEAAI